MKSLFEFISESIDEALPADSKLTGNEVYLRGWERFERAAFDRRLAQERREYEKQMLLPLLASSEEHISFEDDA